MQKLKVKAVADRPVMDPHALAAGVRRYVGKPSAPAKWDEECEAEVVDHAHVRDAVKKGELLAMDAYTAKRCGVVAPEKGAK